MNDLCCIFVQKMPRKDISLLSQRELAITVLSKMLYHIANSIPNMEEIVKHHRNLLKDYLKNDVGKSYESPITDFAISAIPWENILDTIASQSSFINNLIQKYDFSVQEVRYMSAMLCGLSGKEYGLITSFKSHYNLSWSIRQKLVLPSKVSNLRIFLQKLSCETAHES